MRLRQVFHIARYEYRFHVRRWGYLFTTFGLPLLVGIVILGLRWMAGRPEWRTYVLPDLDKPIGIVAPAHLLPNLPDSMKRYPEASMGKRALRQGEILFLVVVPENQDQPWKVYLSGEMSMMDEEVRQHLVYLHALILMGDRISPQELQVLLTPPQVEMFTLGETGSRNTTRLMGTYFVAVAFFIALFVSSGYLLQSVAQEKESRMVELLLSSVTSRELLWGKMLGLSGLGFTQMLVWFAFLQGFNRSLGEGWTFEGLALDPSFIVLGMTVLILGYLMYGLPMAGLGSLGTTMRESQQYTLVVSMLAMTPLFFNALFFLNPNGLIPRVLTFFPWTAPLALLTRMALTPLPWWEIGASVGGMLLGVALSTWVGIRLFRMGLLMFGKRPSWREIWLILRQPT